MSTLSIWSDLRDLPPPSILPDRVQAGITSRKSLRTVTSGCDLSSPWDVLSRGGLGHQSTGSSQGTWVLGYRTAKERKRTLPPLLLPSLAQHPRDTTFCQQRHDPILRPKSQLPDIRWSTQFSAPSLPAHDHESTLLLTRRWCCQQV